MGDLFINSSSKISRFSEGFTQSEALALFFAQPCHYQFVYIVSEKIHHL